MSPSQSPLDRAGQEAEEVLSSLSEVVFRTDAEGNWTYLNAAWQQMTGFSTEETLGSHFLDLVHPDERDATVGMFMAVVMGGAEFCHHETRYARADGSYGWVEVRARVLRDEEGVITANAGTILDISARKRAEELLADQNRVLELVTADRPLAEVLGGVAAMVARQVGSPTSIVHFPVDEEAALDEAVGGVAGLFLTASPEGHVVRGLGPVSEARSAAATPIRGHDSGAAVGALVVHRDDAAPVGHAGESVVARGLELAGLAISRSHREADVRRRALHDPLTALPNRYLIDDRLQQAIADSRRRGTQVAVLLLDLDRFKDVNDMLGHDVGDRVLQEVAKRLSRALRSVDTIGRLGGDEFVVVLPDISGAAAAGQVATKLQAALRPAFEVGGVGVDISASVGISLFPAHGNNLTMLLRRADAAMYRVKPMGGGTAVFEPGYDRGRTSQVSQATRLRRAIDNGELLLEYQPKIDLRTRATVGVEALVRWRHPARGVLPPADFIGLAQETGLIKPLTRWVLDAALAERQRWGAEGAGLSVAVNLSASLLRDPELRTIAVGAVERWGLPAGLLELEVTESALLTDPEAAIRVMWDLRQAGVTFALDDFGTGYSSLSHLKRMPARTLKIDKSFVHDLTTDPRDASIVQAVVHLGHDLGIAVVAEGVEQEETLRRVAELGCDQAQGFHLARPMSADDLPAWLTGAFPPRPRE